MRKPRDAQTFASRNLLDGSVGLRPHLEGLEDALDTAAFLAELLET